jgi:hypothetical protein
MKKFFLTIMLLIPLFVFGQKEYLPGFIITQQNDTIYGLVQSSTAKKMGKVCVFKTSLGTEKFSPASIRGYQISGNKAFASKVILIKDEPVPVFLEYLVDGKADLLYYKDKRGERFFIQNELDSLYELKNTEIIWDGYFGKVAEERKEYLYTLKSVFNDNQEIQKKIHQTPFEHKKLIELTQLYHEKTCSDKACIVYEKDIKPRLVIGLTTGIFQSNLSFVVKDDLYAFLNQENFQSRISFQTSMLFSFQNIFGFHKNLSINLLPGYQKNIYQSQNILMEIDNLRIPLYFSYTFPIGKFKPFFNFGISNTFWVNHHYVDPKRPWVEQRLQFAKGRYQLGSFLGVGIVYDASDRFSYMVFSNHELGSGITAQVRVHNNYLSSTTQLVGINFGVKYRF